MEAYTCLDTTALRDDSDYDFRRSSPLFASKLTTLAQIIYPFGQPIQFAKKSSYYLSLPFVFRSRPEQVLQDPMSNSQPGLLILNVHRWATGCATAPGKVRAVPRVSALTVQCI